MQPLCVVYRMRPHAKAGRVLTFHRQHKHAVRRSSLLTIRVDGQRFSRRQRCRRARQPWAWPARKLAVCVRVLELALQQGCQAQVSPAGQVAGNLLIEEGDVRLMGKPLVEQA